MLPASFTALYDACVLYPPTVRDFLMELATTGLFRAKWSADIHEEWIRSVLRDRPDLTREKLGAIQEKMDAHVPDALVTDYEFLIDGLQLPDQNDRHVLAAAVRCNAGVIVTFNLDDFPSAVLERHDIEAQHPDEFVLYLLDLDAFTVCEAAGRMKDRWTRHSSTREEFVTKLARAGFRETARELGLRCPRLQDDPASSTAEN